MKMILMYYKLIKKTGSDRKVICKKPDINNLIDGKKIIDYTQIDLNSNQNNMFNQFDSNNQTINHDNHRMIQNYPIYKYSATNGLLVKEMDNKYNDLMNATHEDVHGVKYQRDTKDGKIEDMTLHVQGPAQIFTTKDGQKLTFIKGLLVDPQQS